MTSTVEHIGINPDLMFGDPWKMQIAMLPARRPVPCDPVAEKTRPGNAECVAHSNRLILSCLHKYKCGLTVTDLVELTGLSRIAVNRRANALVSSGLAVFRNVSGRRVILFKENA